MEWTKPPKCKSCFHSRSLLVLCVTAQSCYSGNTHWLTRLTFPDECADCITVAYSKKRCLKLPVYLYMTFFNRP